MERGRLREERGTPNGVWDNEGVRVREAAACPLCSNPGVPLYGDLRDRNFKAPGRWSLRRCGSCGHGWLDPMPEAGELAKLYPSYWEHYDSVFHRGGSAWDVSPGPSLVDVATQGALAAMGYSAAASSRVATFFARALPLMPPLMEILEGAVMSLRWRDQGHLLDVGCGDGSFLVLMRSIGWTVAGIEASRDAAKVARERHGLEIREGNIEEVDLPDTYDAITMQHIIEHVREPVRVLGATRVALKPGGVLSIRTPNLDSLGHARFRDLWMPLDPPRHLHLFTPSTLATCVKKAGFTIVNAHTSPRIAQGVFDSSRAIRKSHATGLNTASEGRSLGSRLFIAQEALLCTVGRDVGEEIVLLATQ
jgi:2-polyprenyl-3-methyl-5-hydroxy-6-metoxy-1,4-benzoquinol methylase